MDDLYTMGSYITSEEEIPEEFMSEIDEPIDLTFKTTFTPGTLGEKTTQVADAFKNKSNYYFGHGTPVSDATIEVIVNEGLAVKDSEAASVYMGTLRGLESAAICFGSGTETLFKEREDLLNAWEHKGSENIVIVSLPKKYALDPEECIFGADLYEAYYIGDEDIGYHLRPEFILGVYNSTEKCMRMNSNYYANLSDEKQKELFEDIEERYAVSYANYGMAPPEKDRFADEENYKKSALIWYKNQYGIFKNNEEFQNASSSDDKLFAGAEDAEWFGLDLDDVVNDNKQL